MICLGDHEIGGDGGDGWWCPMICFGDHESVGVDEVDGVTVVSVVPVEVDDVKGLALVL